MKTFSTIHNKYINFFMNYNINLRLCVYHLIKTSLIKRSKRLQCVIVFVIKTLASYIIYLETKHIHDYTLLLNNT